MAYTYKFIDGKGNTIYIGKTIDLNRRMADHFTKGHLAKECYNSVARIEYKKWKTESDALIMETYYITKYAPKFNKLQQSRDTPTLLLEDNQDWKLYKQFKEVKPLKRSDTGYWKYIAWIYLLVMALLCLYNML